MMVRLRPGLVTTDKYLFKKHLVTTPLILEFPNVSLTSIDIDHPLFCCLSYQRCQETFEQQKGKEKPFLSIGAIERTR